MTTLRVYGDDEVRARLAAELPAWSLKLGHITRSFRTGDWVRAMALANAIGYAAEAAWHHPSLLVSWGRVIVRLRTNGDGPRRILGITERDFHLAHRIEDLATWRPTPNAELQARADGLAPPDDDDG
jgi:4a-hydroxytetrahydrobiopterin dehydratase